VQSEYPKRVIVFSVEKPVDIRGKYCGVHIDSYGKLVLEVAAAGPPKSTPKVRDGSGA